MTYAVNQGKDFALETVTYAVKKLADEGLEGSAFFRRHAISTLRSARSLIHQPTLTNEQSLTIAARNKENRASRISISAASARLIQRAIEHVKETMRVLPENGYLPDLLPQPKDLPEERIQGSWDEETAFHDQNLERRRKFFAKAEAAAQWLGLTSSVRFYTGESEIAVANTSGLLRYFRFSAASCELTILSDPAASKGRVSAFACRAGTRISDINTDEIIWEAMENARAQKILPFYNPFNGNGKEHQYFDVILLPYALDAWLYWLADFSFNGTSLYNETSFMSGKIGQRITSSEITITDDWMYPDMIPAPFDAEGMTRQRVPLIEKGVAKGVVCDGTTSKRSTLKRTGHTTIPYHNYSRPLHLVFEGDDYSLDELIEASERPTILITYFNYPSITDAREGTFTATSRHGTFLLKDGKFIAVTPPLRFMEKTRHAFGNIRMKTRPMLVSTQEHYDALEPLSYMVPVVRMENAHFMGTA